MKIRIILFCLILSLLVGCDLMDMIPDYKFSTQVNAELVCGEYSHKHPEYDAYSSVLVLKADGTYQLDGSSGPEINFFPQAAGNYTISIESFSIHRAEGIIVFTGKDAETEYEELNTRRALFTWVVDKSNEYDRTLTLEFSADEVVVYEFTRTLA